MPRCSLDVWCGCDVMLPPLETMSGMRRTASPHEPRDNNHPRCDRRLHHLHRPAYRPPEKPVALLTGIPQCARDRYPRLPPLGRITKATEQIDTALAMAKEGDAGKFAILLALFVAGFGLGLLSLVYFERRVIRPSADDARLRGASPMHLALMIAVSIGVHNFSEGLAIGKSARSGRSASRPSSSSASACTTRRKASASPHC
jgi:hypothetical protein